MPTVGVFRQVTDSVGVVLAGNPGPMTLDGTNSYLLAAPGSRTRILVDPGPDDADHVQRLVDLGGVELVLITHRHADHTGASQAFAALTGVPVRAADPEFCLGGSPLVDDEVVSAGGLQVRVVATPGHTSDSVCFEIAGDGASGSVLTGDTILGRGTTVIAPPDGALRPYLDSLHRLSGLGPRRVLPAHGPDLPDLVAVCAAYREHREQRLAAVRAVLDQVGPNATVGEVTDAVYTDIDPAVRAWAEMSVQAQLDFLRA